MSDAIYCYLLGDSDGRFSDKKKMRNHSVGEFWEGASFLWMSDVIYCYRYIPTESKLD